MVVPDLLWWRRSSKMLCSVPTLTNHLYDLVEVETSARLTLNLREQLVVSANLSDNIYKGSMNEKKEKLLLFWSILLSTTKFEEAHRLSVDLILSQALWEAA